jgi:uncharacterized protein YecT (DUF1311 family)
MRYFFAIVLFGLQLNCFAQTSTTAMPDVTAEVQLKLKQEVETEIPGFKKQLEKFKVDTATITFKIDTFRVERLMQKWVSLNYSDYSMKEATLAAARSYDALLNKYYKKLNKSLKPADRKKLTDAQKTWLAYRDSEQQLILAVDNEAYSGGSIEGLTDIASFLDLVKQRTIMLFEYYETLRQE